MIIELQSHRDQFLINRVNNRDEIAASCFLTFSSGRLLRICRSALGDRQLAGLETPEDLSQQVGRIFVEETRKGSFQRKPLENVDAFFSWFSTVANRKVIDASRLLKNHVTFEFIDGPESRDIEDDFVDPLLDIQLQEWLETLPDEHLLVVERLNGGCSPRAIAEELGVSHESVRRMRNKICESYLSYQAGTPRPPKSMPKLSKRAGKKA